MTPKERDRLLERKRQSYRRRLQSLRDAHSLPALTNRQREALLDAIMLVEGDAVTDPDLRTMYRLTTRGMIL